MEQLAKIDELNGPAVIYTYATPPDRAVRPSLAREIDDMELIRSLWPTRRCARRIRVMRHRWRIICIDIPSAMTTPASATLAHWAYRAARAIENTGGCHGAGCVSAGKQVELAEKRRPGGTMAIPWRWRAESRKLTLCPAPTDRLRCEHLRDAGRLRLTRSTR